MKQFLYLATILFGFPLATPAHAQNTPQDCQVTRGRGCSDETPEQKMDRQRGTARNKERQEALKKETDKLLALATELKNYVDKSNENMLSLDVIKKAEEIEKLAKGVREKMKADFMMPGPDANPLGDARRNLR